MIVRGERGEHPLSKSDWIRVVPATGGLVGPGWVAIIRNRKVQFGGEEHLGWLPEGAAIPAPTPPEIVTLDFEIQAADGGYLLIWQGTERRHCGDTWHASVDAAMEQAKVWFGIEPQEWSSP
jgi:hypothetical protein